MKISYRMYNSTQQLNYGFSIIPSLFGTQSIYYRLNIFISFRKWFSSRLLPSKWKIYIAISFWHFFFVWASWFYSIILFCFVVVSRTHSCNNTSTHRQRMCSIWLNTITLYMGLCHSICKQFYVLFYWWCWASWCCCECLFLLMANASIWIFFGSFTCMFLRTFRIFFLLCVFNLTSSISVVEYTQIVYYLYELYLIHKNSINCL